MNNLHAYFALKNEQAFAKALDASRAYVQPPTPSSSAGKRSMMTMSAASAGADVNSRDWLGRTVLHLACSLPEPYALSYVRLLLAHPAINVNVQDVESRWTALHRALYAGNISAW
jgi:ankyrin repeat protein